MSIDKHSRYEAIELMEMIGDAYTIINCLKNPNLCTKEAIQKTPEEYEELKNGLEYLYRFLSMFAWLTIGAKAMGKHYHEDKEKK